MKTMRYKGYIVSIEISEEDDCLYGKVLGLPHNIAITYEGDTVAALRQDFNNAVDAYLVSCEQNGIQPQKSYTGTLNVRISPETHLRIALLANREGMSINAYIKQALDKQVTACEMVE